MKAKAPKFQESFYAVMDPTTKDILKKCRIKEAAAWGKIIYAEQGIKCVAPVIGAVSMSFAWGSEVFERAEAMHADNTPAEVLEARVAKYYPDGELAEPVLPTVVSKAPGTPRQPRDPNAPAPVPREGSVTRRVWAIADEVLARLGSSDMKAVRADVAAQATAEEINPSTVSVQYSKWKASPEVQAKISA